MNGIATKMRKLIHASSLYSGPQDVLSWAAARELKRAFGADTKEVILANTKQECGWTDLVAFEG
jgi:hypothetical protein